jgi:proteic killer suppression protein
MLKIYRHIDVQFAETGPKAGIQPEHTMGFRRILSALDAATCPANMNAPGYALHPAKDPEAVPAFPP